VTLSDLRRLTAALPPYTVLVWAVPGGLDALPRPRLARVRTKGDVWVEAAEGAEVLVFDGKGRTRWATE